VWFGFRSFWGHLRHLAASAVATEDIDSRDWMTPDDPTALARAVAEVLGATAAGDGTTLVESLGRDLWIDYVADTGDDSAVSMAVARIVFAEYELPDPDRDGEAIAAPRGDVLLFGGDTAYPVATAQEITNRVLVPWNRVLAERKDDRTRVLLGIPGNHDWYDGLDGFGRMFRRRDDEEGEEHRPSVMKIRRRPFQNQAKWARELLRGGKVDKPPVLVLDGYVPVQNASYFVLPLAPAMHLVAADRQLKSIDTRQRRYYRRFAADNPDSSPWVLLPDPLFAFGQPSATGVDAVHRLGLEFDAQSHFILSGDVHHYERIVDERLLHVVAGGGGAFLHPASRDDAKAAAVRWPDAAQSRALLALVPWKVAVGRSGLIPHAALAIIFAPSMILAATGTSPGTVFVVAPAFTTLALTVVFALLGGVRQKAVVAAYALVAALVTAAIPVVSAMMILFVLHRLDVRPSRLWVTPITYFAAVFAGAGVFGAYLALLTHRGVEQTQAFTGLDHPGFKHFLRLRVRADGSAVDGWCIGIADPLREGEEPVLVDTFTWRP
jgi:hypothetical protein